MISEFFANNMNEKIKEGIAVEKVQQTLSSSLRPPDSRNTQWPRLRSLFFWPFIGLLSFASLTGCGTATSSSYSTGSAASANVGTSSLGVNGATTSGTDTTQAVSVKTDTNNTLSVVDNKTLGPILVDNKGMVVYLFTKDSQNKSTVTGLNAAIWPPLLVPPGNHLTPGRGVTGKLSTLTRANGKRQVTYNGIPLYVYSGDLSPGQTNGEGILHEWYVVHPNSTAALLSASASIATTRSASSNSNSAGSGNSSGSGW